MLLGASSAGSYSTILMFVVIIVIMYFMMIRPQKKQQQKRQEMMSSLKRGDRVVTIGGLHGVIDSINQEEKTVTLDCDGIYLVFNLGAVGKVVPTKSEELKDNQNNTETESVEDTTTDTADDDVVTDTKVTDDKKEE